MEIIEIIEAYFEVSFTDFRMNSVWLVEVELEGFCGFNDAESRDFTSLDLSSVIYSRAHLLRQSLRGLQAYSI